MWPLKLMQNEFKFYEKLKKEDEDDLISNKTKVRNVQIGKQIIFQTLWVEEIDKVLSFILYLIFKYVQNVRFWVGGGVGV